MVISIARVGVRVRVMKLFRILLKYTLRLGCQRKERAGERKIERDTHTVKDRERECERGEGGREGGDIFLDCFWRHSGTEKDPVMSLSSS